jgi:superfamily I DNA and/or RNA helicase
VIIFIFHSGNKELIENERRLNVALSRAKNKFIIIGSYEELKKINVWIDKLIQLLLPDQININKEFLEGILLNKLKK